MVKLQIKKENGHINGNFLMLRNIYVFKKEKGIKSINIHNIMY
jgi:hypothetical protein